ncbi:MAG: type IV secretion system protein [Novosphingobium sp.]
MACEQVNTGQRFVAEMLGHIDCQAQAIGAYGYGALSDPNSALAAAFTGLLTIFVAIFGLRLIAGEPLGGRDVVGDVLRAAIVVTLATSWPAWRTLGYDVVIKGPDEIAGAIAGASELAAPGGDMTARLQSADDGIVLLTVFGTGRNTGGANRSDTIGDSFRGIALADQQGLADGRIAFLAGVIAPLAIVRLGAGLLLALAPVVAGLLLFAGTRDLFFGWLRGLAAMFFGAVALSIAIGVELAVLEPWLRDALALREAQVLTPSVPTELSVITYAFALVSFGFLAGVAKIFFFGGFGVPRLFAASRSTFRETASVRGEQGLVPVGDAPSRAFVVAEAVAQTLRREERSSDRIRTIGGAALARNEARSASGIEPQVALGSSYRGSEARRLGRGSAAGERRDSKA